MHRHIVEAIQGVIKGHNVMNEDLEVYVKTQTSGGFWGMVIIATKDKDYWLPHVESISKSLGRAYGEQLSTQMLGPNVLNIW